MHVSVLHPNLLISNKRRTPEHSLDEAVSFAKSMNVPEVYLTHASHQLGLDKDVNSSLPEGYYLAYDGLKITIQ